MTAIMHTGTTVNTEEHQVLAAASGLLEDLDAFLRDPIGYGDYDFADPITLAEFDTMRHMRHRTIHVLT